MKWAGLVSLCTAIALTGLYLSRLQGKKLKFIKELNSFFCEIGEMGDAGLSDFRGMLHRLRGTGKYKELKGIIDAVSGYESGENLKALWDSAVGTFCPFYVNSEIRSLLLSFSEIFGRGTRDSFVRRCKDLSFAAGSISEAEEKKYEKNRGITVYSAVLTAAAIFFILI